VLRARDELTFIRWSAHHVPFLHRRAALRSRYARRVGDGWTSVRLGEIEPITVAGSLQWHPVRRTLGVEAFGINAYTAENVGDHVVEEHTESTLQHEEVYIVLTGRATFRLGDEALDAPAGAIVFVRDPAVKRHAWAEEPGTSVLAVGGKPGEPYRPSAWESFFYAERHRPHGDFAAMADELSAALELHPDHPTMLYSLACAEAQAGRLDEARVHLERSLELRPELQEWADKDDDLVPLREAAAD